MIRYYKNGRLDDAFGTGVSIEVRDDGAGSVARTAFVSSDGEEQLGYLAEEITAEAAAVWQQRIAAPDMITYFPGLFPGIGVVDKSVHERLQQEQEKQWIATRVVTRLAFFMALAEAGYKKSRLLAIAKKQPAADRLRAEMLVAEGIEFRRNDALLARLLAELGLDAAAIDALFVAAANDR